MTPQGEGRACQKLLAMLRERGWEETEPGWVITQGAQRNGRDGLDCAKWGLYVRPTSGGRREYLYSQNRITDCVRFGFVIGPYEVHGREVTVGAAFPGRDANNRLIEGKP